MTSPLTGPSSVSRGVRPGRRCRLGRPVADDRPGRWRMASWTDIPGGVDLRELIVPRAELAVGAAVRPAGLWAFEALRVAAGRPAARRRDRPPHHPARGRLAAHGRPPGQGLLPRPGDRGPGAQPGPPAAPARAAAPRRLARPAARAGAPRSSSTARPSASSAPARHHELGPIALAVVKRNVPVTVRSRSRASPQPSRSWSCPSRSQRPKMPFFFFVGAGGGRAGSALGLRAGLRRRRLRT